MTIHQLPKELINKIAAGEVIERPVSVVKELVENSIDAGATEIEVAVSQGGKKLIRVKDNGHGIPKEELSLAIKRHCTSKINSENDLFSIGTLGFRGEALSSITAVARCVIVTKHKESKDGLKIKTEDGAILDKKEIPAEVGTTIFVEDLFYNTPARLHYLKSDAVEFQHIVTLMTKFILCYPNISFRLLNEDKPVLNVRAAQDPVNTIAQVWGTEIAKNMIPVKYEDDYLAISGLTGKPYVTKIDRSYQVVFVNGRAIKNPAIYRAITDAYYSLLFLERQPICVLHVTIDPTKLDVNVHPKKDVVRFEKEAEIYNSVFEAIKQTLTLNNLIPSVEKKEAQHPSPFRKKVVKEYHVDTSKQMLIKETVDEPEEKVVEVVAEQQPSEFQTRFGNFKILGQLHKTYIIIETDNGMLLVDQHAAEERVNFEKVKHDFSKGTFQVQQLVSAISIETDMKESALLSQNLSKLEEIGFKIEFFGEQMFKISQMPSYFIDLDQNDVKNLIFELIKTFQSQKLIQSVYDAIAMRACKQSIKAGDELTIPQMNSLLQELEKCNQPYACPHGRPTIIEITSRDIEKMMKRVA